MYLIENLAVPVCAWCGTEGDWPGDFCGDTCMGRWQSARAGVRYEDPDASPNAHYAYDSSRMWLRPRYVAAKAS
jgi:hypothetical protein